MRRLAEAWEGFWWTPVSTAPLVALRIAVGVLALGSALVLWPDVAPFFAATWLGAGGARAVVSGLAAAALALVVGAATRAAGALMLLALALLAATNPFIFNSGDTLLRHLVLVVALGPAGAALSVDARRAGGAARVFPRRPAWPLRLVQLQVAVLYAAAVLHKLVGYTWRAGTAAAYPLRIPDVTRFAVPPALVEWSIAPYVFTWGTLAVEAAIPLLVWHRRLRPWVLGMGVLLHLTIDVTLRAGFFSWVVLASYLAFVPPDTMEALLARYRSSRTRW